MCVSSGYRHRSGLDAREPEYVVDHHDAGLAEDGVREGYVQREWLAVRLARERTTR
jgi:hypothetical protein